ncbi:MAG TPA: hypothetical protein V6D17_04600 [Candidatus Obscuribacterales bacterium]
MSEPTNTHDGGSEKNCASCTQMFQLSMGMFDRALSAGDFQVGLHWLRQAGNLTAGSGDALKLQKDAYARLINAAAAKSIQLSLHSGNITQNHRDLAESIEHAAGSLLSLSPGDEKAVAHATVVAGFAGQLSKRLTRFQVAEEYVTSAEKLDGVLDCLFAIVEHASALDSRPEEALPSVCDRLALASTAVSNADCYLTWFFPKKLSDWDKAELMCRRAAQWLKDGDELRVDPNYDDCNACDVIAALNAAADALRQHDYKKSKKLLKAAEEALAEVSCV